MKLATIYAFFTFGISVTVGITTAPFPHPRGSRDVLDARDPWDGADVVYYYTRVVWDREGSADNSSQELGARYLDSSYELSDREYEEIEIRQVAQVVKLAVKGIMKVIEAITKQIAADKDMRGKYTSALVDKLYNRYRKFNFVVCHTDHKTDFKGKQGKDWGHIHHEVDVAFHKTIGYEIYWFKDGTFHRYGDGGYLNWAYYGNVVSTSNGGKDVVFAKRG
ncbi:hypothetical protein HYPSUDRAFT_67703 [Hypholoma sublateritium FD-334 SS-4]|uniref:DUF7888 domain-containing protein n=1 Tax=Hypholoma sublateritium (strain FD-334 SS-4) TaxID=945553 RepID=A0A0D2MDI0_HYPSF|nr:hypothetical protein HYPSUDRAFT_67703 [Hypholoma sublateritium FD-334 SS-4]